MTNSITNPIYNERAELLQKNIPDEIRQTPNWVLWRSEPRGKNGLLTKVPYRPNGLTAKSNDPSTWSTFDEVLVAFRGGGFDGIGWCVPLDGETRYWGFDYDDAIDSETGDFNEWRLPDGQPAPIQPKDVIKDLATYTERTPSGVGFRAYAKCTVDVPRGKEQSYGERNPKTGKIPGIEIYSTGRFFTFTGDQLPGSPNTIEERTSEASALHARVFPDKPVVHKTERASKPRSQRSEPHSDEKIDQLACDLVDGHIGSRHHLLLAVIGTLLTLKWERDKIASLLNVVILLFNREDPTYDIDSNVPKYHGTLEDCIERKGKGEVIAGFEALRKAVEQSTFDVIYASLVEYSWDDVGNGRRLVDKHRNIIRYCADEECWYGWDGVRWNNNDLAISELAKGIASDIRAEASALEPPPKTGDKETDKEAFESFERRRNAILRWANQSGNASHLSATTKCASSDPRIRCQRSDFDSHHHLLNCPNGIIDLKRGTLLEHDRNLMLSYLCPTEFHPHARHPIFDESLAAFTRNHSDLAPFLKTLIGYTTQGTKSEERIVILHGKGNAGKGTLMDWLSNTLGPDYCCRMDYNSVRKQDRNSASASGDIARLEGKRVVIVSEIEKGSRLAESFMKSASGNDAIVARWLFKGEREFAPTHQFLFQTNYRPGFDSMDSGNRRRYIEVPFDNDLSTDPLVKFDGKIKTTMRQDKAFLQAVLAWAVAGSVDWYANGLHLPESVVAATTALFAQNDFLFRFMDDCFVKDPQGRVEIAKVTDIYVRWCSRQGEEPAKGRTFNHMMEERGFEQKVIKLHRKATRMWQGLRLKAECDLEEVGGLTTQGVYYEAIQ